FPNEYQPSWLVEGIAVYYESLLTGAGRLAGSEHRMIARTAAMQRAVPRIDQLSLASPHFPYGYSVYAYGSLFVDHIARTHGDSSVRSFIESSARQLVPLYLNGPARHAFRRSFTSEYRIWAESLLAQAPPDAPPIPGWRQLTREGAYASFPRWLSDSSLVYTGTPGKESNAAYKLSCQSSHPEPLTSQRERPSSHPDPLTSHPERSEGSTVSGIEPTTAGEAICPRVTRTRLGRRNSRTPNSVLADGSLLYSQLEFNSPYEIRSDLYVESPRGRTRRLTHGARLAFPDARDDGAIVAVQVIPAGSRLARVSRDGRNLRAITSGGPDEQWSDPRWSPDGRHVVAVRWLRGGTSEIVVVDTAGAIVQTLIRERTVNSAPSWSSDGRYVYFSSDRTGVSNLYVGAFRPAFADTMMVPDLQRVSDARTGLFEPQPSPSGNAIAASIFQADGYHIGAAPASTARSQNADALAAVTARSADSAQTRSGTITRYSPWRTLLPRYWIPFFESGLDDNSARIGALTSAEDVVGRHGYQALLFVPTDNTGITGSLYYRNARLGQPLIELAATQDWENYLRVFDQSQGSAPIGILRRRTREASLSFTLLRPRARTASYLSFAAGVEARDYRTDIPSLMQRIDSAYGRTYNYPQLIASAGWGNAQYPPLAISPEDGINFATTTRMRWLTGDTTGATISIVGTASAFKSLDLPGYAHHVLALHGAAGIEDSRGTGYYEVGGVSGGFLDVLPGYALGEGRRTFPVRGFPSASLLGIRAFTATGEYRIPLTLPGRGLGTLPMFLDRTSLTAFGDVGSAWCPAIYGARPTPSPSLCTTGHVSSGLVFLTPELIGSTGAELNVTAAIFSWDVPVRFRLGFAVPVVGTGLVPVNSVTSYFAVGASF
ncbi:MAG TPA: hypothetical protein VKH19_10485, partial [Gemmatimonadaceae bacterium]|nr:hypothetical protein [Gemmatimonadaceae bacterium]